MPLLIFYKGEEERKQTLICGDQEQSNAAKKMAKGICFSIRNMEERSSMQYLLYSDRITENDLKFEGEYMQSSYRTDHKFLYIE